MPAFEQDAVGPDGRGPAPSRRSRATSNARSSRIWGAFARDRSGVIAIMFALLMVPLIIVVALSVDFSFYIVSQAQLNLAADAAAMHAVRVASQYYVDNTTTVAAAEAQGITAGQQWFAAQAGNAPWPPRRCPIPMSR